MNLFRKIVTACVLTMVMTGGRQAVIYAASLQQTILDSRETKCVITDLDDRQESLEKITKLLSDSSVENVIVLDDSLGEEKQYEIMEMKGRSKYYHYRVKDVRYVGQIYGTTVLAKANGEPGTTLAISVSKSVSASYNATVNIPSSYVTSGVGFSVTKSTTIAVSGSATVPKKHSGKKVKRMTLIAYPLYDKYSFTAQRQLVKNVIQYPWEDWGTGTALKPVGYYFAKSYTYK